jgi:hypothetical protein
LKGKNGYILSSNNRAFLRGDLDRFLRVNVHTAVANCCVRNPNLTACCIAKPTSNLRSDG